MVGEEGRRQQEGDKKEMAGVDVLIVGLLLLLLLGVDWRGGRGRGRGPCEVFTGEGP